jgi:putative ABC transport system permease protein
MVDSHGLNTFGGKLIAGRDFKPDEMQNVKFGDRVRPPSIIVSKALADKLFPDGNAVGKQVYLDEDPPTSTIIGVVDRMQEPWVTSTDIENATFLPVYMPYGNATRYLVRTEPGRRDEVMKQVEQKLSDANHNRIIGKMKTIEKVRIEAYASDRAMAIILGGVIAALLTITALGIVGMASFWVAQRTRQIGTRRALGATRFDILRYFLTENFLITTMGLLVGSLLTYSFNYWLIAHYQAEVMPVAYLLCGIMVLWLLGQIAVFGPARRASNVPPAVATRSV